MKNELAAAPADLQRRLGALHDAIKADRDGGDLRRLDNYFADCEARARQMRLRASEYDDKAFADLLADACGASRRVLQQAWQLAHA